MMIKTIVIVGLVIIGIAALTFISFISVLSWQARKQPPSYGIIEQKYYVCRKKKLLHGGIFGKGLLLRFPENNTSLWCWRNEWEEIDRATFKKLATQWYKKDWSKESHFWSER